MSKKRGLSLEEKREKMLQIFYDSQDFFLNEMVQFADNDPATLEAMRNAIEVAHHSANRWTDNIFTLREWCSNTFPQTKEQLEHLYTEVGITDDFDYLQLSSFPLSSSHDPATARQLPENEAEFCIFSNRTVVIDDLALSQNPPVLCNSSPKGCNHLSPELFPLEDEVSWLPASIEKLAIPLAYVKKGKRSMKRMSVEKQSG